MENPFEAVQRGKLKNGTIKVCQISLKIILTGIVSGSSVCMTSKMEECKAELMLKFQAGDEICPTMVNITDCVKAITKECTEESNHELMDTIEFLVEMCRNGSEINKMFVKHKDCVFNSLTQTNHCLDVAKKAFDESEGGAPVPEDFVRVACKHMDEINNCVFLKIRELCGQEAEEFAQKGLEPQRRMNEKACLEGGYPTGNGVAGPSIAIAVNILQFLLLISISKMFF